MKTFIRLLVFLSMTATAQAGCNVGSLPFILQNGTVADADQVMANFNAVVSSVQAHCASAGVNSDITALSGLTSPIGPTLGGSVNFFGTGGGTANGQTVTVLYPGTGWQLTAGYTITWVPSAANTGSATLAVAGSAAKPLLKKIGTNLVNLSGGELQPSIAVSAVYDGTNYELNNLPSQIATGGTQATTANQARLNIGAAASGINNDITQLAALTTPISVAQGGTGSAGLPLGFVVGQGASPLTTVGIPLAVSNGGTGTNTMPTGLLVGNGTGPITTTPSPIAVGIGGTGQAVLTNGQFLIGTGTTPVGFLPNPLPPNNGGTGVAGPAAGVLIAQGASPVVTQNPLGVGIGGTGAINPPAGVVVSQGGANPMVTQNPLSVGLGGTGQTTLPVGFILGQNASPVITTPYPLLPGAGGTGLTSIPAGFMFGQGTSAITTIANPLPVGNGGTGQSNLSPGFVFGQNGSPVTIVASPLPVGNGGTGVSNISPGFMYGQNGSSIAIIADPLPVNRGGTGRSSIGTPVTRVYISGSGTDNPSGGTQYQQLILCGGGGGGAGTTGAGGAGGATTVGGVTANGGGGANLNTGGSGGSGSSGASIDFPGVAAPNGTSIAGSSGLNETFAGTCSRASAYPPWGTGGCGGTATITGSGQQSAGGGSADCKMIWTGAGSWTFSVGGGGSAGTGGSPTGGQGGIFAVTDFYQ